MFRALQRNLECQLGRTLGRRELRTNAIATSARHHLACIINICQLGREGRDVFREGEKSDARAMRLDLRGVRKKRYRIVAPSRSRKQNTSVFIFLRAPRRLTLTLHSSQPAAVLPHTRPSIICDCRSRSRPSASKSIQQCNYNSDYNEPSGAVRGNHDATAAPTSPTRAHYKFRPKLASSNLAS